MAIKFLHTADLHIGKRVNGELMIDEQKHVIAQLVSIAREEQVDGILIAGDVFDRPIPSREALETCELLFSQLCSLDVPVFVIPGNHDSPQQLAFCSALLGRSGLHIAKAYAGHIDRFTIEKGGERACIHLLPFVRPTDVRMAHQEEDPSIASHHDAVVFALSHDVIEGGACNILVAHQFVTNASFQPETCDSEVLSIGGSDNVDVKAFDAYDYVALGHLHGPQRVGRDQVRYSGSPLKYSFSEVKHHKGVTIVEVESGCVSVSTRELTPLHDMREVCASYEELLAGKDKGNPTDYMRVTLTDRSLPDAMAKLRALYPNILRLDWQEFITPLANTGSNAVTSESKTPIELFAEFYERQIGEPLSKEGEELVLKCIEEGEVTR